MRVARVGRLRRQVPPPSGDCVRRPRCDRPVRLRCSRRCGQQARTEPSNAGAKLAPIDGVLVVNEKTWSVVCIGDRLDDALCGPPSTRPLSHPEMHQAAPPQRQTRRIPRARGIASSPPRRSRTPKSHRGGSDLTNFATPPTSRSCENRAVVPNAVARTLTETHSLLGSGQWTSVSSDMQKAADELRAGETGPLSITWYCDLFRPSRIQEDRDRLGWPACDSRCPKFRAAARVVATTKGGT